MRQPAAAILLLATLACDAAARDPDAVLYRRAHELTVAGKHAEARALYLQIIRPDAGSRFQPDAHLALAELHFNQSSNPSEAPVVTVTEQELRPDADRLASSGDFGGLRPPLP